MRCDSCFFSLFSLFSFFLTNNDKRAIKLIVENKQPNGNDNEQPKIFYKIDDFQRLDRFRSVGIEKAVPNKDNYKKNLDKKNETIEEKTNKIVVISSSEDEEEDVEVDVEESTNDGDDEDEDSKRVQKSSSNVNANKANLDRIPPGETINNNHNVDDAVHREILSDENNQTKSIKVNEDN